MQNKTKEPSRIDMWVKENGEVILVLLVVIAMIGTMIVWIADSNQREDARLAETEERISTKANFLTSDAFTQFDIVNVEWERRVGSEILNTPDDIFDLYIVEMSNGELSRVAVFDTPVGDKYLVEPYTPE